MTRLLALLVLALAASPALAQKPDVAALETSAKKHYELAEYDAAIADFKEAFRLSDAPGYLFNIAQAYRLAGNCREAATFYKTFLRRVPDAPNAAKVRTEIAEMETCAAKQPEPAPPPPTTTTTTAPAPTPPPATAAAPAAPQPDADSDDEERPQPREDRRWMQWTGIGAAGAGAIGLGLGVKFALDGRARGDDLKKTCAVSCTSAQALAIVHDGDAANRNAVIATVAGGVMLAGGAVLFVLSRMGHETPSVAIVPTPGGAAASYGFAF
ncbi:MAG: tetratricopeptide repeat protein [Acidobacteriota bacterium]